MKKKRNYECRPRELRIETVHKGTRLPSIITNHSVDSERDFVEARAPILLMCKCGNDATSQCEFPLFGKKRGQTCSAKLCDKCAIVISNNELRPNIGDNVIQWRDGDKTFCGAHGRLVKK